MIFLARIAFSLQKPIGKDQQEEWINKLGATKISIVFASGYLNSPASSFGHTFLKLSNPKNAGGLELLDYGINYAARTGDTQGALYALYGLFGYFKGSFGLLPYHQMIKEYTNLEGRDLWEYELNFTEEEVKNLLRILLNEEQIQYDYYFLTDNCSYRILWLLNRVRPELQFFQKYKPYVVPIDTIKEVVKMPGLVSMITYRPSLKTKYENYKNQIHKEDQNNEVDPINKKLKELELQILAYTIKDNTNPQIFQLTKERASFVGTTEWQEIVRPDPPHQGTEPRMIGVGQFDHGLELNLRMAFHNYLSNPIGSPRWSNLEFFRLQVRHDQNQQTYLNKFVVADIFSSSGIDSYFSPTSWGLTLATSYDYDQKKHNEYLAGTMGFSYDLDDLQNHRIYLGGAMRQNRNLNLGMKLILLNQWAESFRSEIRFETYNKKPELNLRYNLDQNLEIYFESDSRSLGIYKYF